jgi:hypothetical protein
VELLEDFLTCTSGLVIETIFVIMLGSEPWMFQTIVQLECAGRRSAQILPTRSRRNRTPTGIKESSSIPSHPVFCSASGPEHFKMDRFFNAYTWNLFYLVES